MEIKAFTWTFVYFRFSHPASVGRWVIILIVWMRSHPVALTGAVSCPPFTQLDKGAQALEVPQVAHLAPGPAQSSARLGRGPGFVLSSVLGALSPRGGTRALGSVWHCGAFSQFLLNDCGKNSLSEPQMGGRIHRPGLQMPHSDRSHHLTEPTEPLWFVTRPSRIALFVFSETLRLWSCLASW